MKPNYEYVESPAALRVLAILDQVKKHEFELIVDHHRRRTCRKTARHLIDDDVLKTSLEYLDLATLAKSFPDYLSDLFMARLEDTASIKEVKCLVRAQLLCALAGASGIDAEAGICYSVSCGFFDLKQELDLEDDPELLLKGVEHQLGVFENPRAY